LSTKVTVSLIDDVDGELADKTVQFGLDGVSYEIDLSEKNANRMREDLLPWVEAGRRIAGSRRRRAAGSGGVSVDREQSAEIRAWARKDGYQVAGRGRIPAEVLEAYRAAK
jgi:Lsr2